MAKIWEGTHDDKELYSSNPNFLFSDDCTGNFKRISTNNKIKETNKSLNLGVQEYKFIILQEIETKRFFVKKKSWIPLKETFGYNDRNVGAFTEKSVDKKYEKVIEKYKPIMREKRLKKLLG